MLTLKSPKIMPRVAISKMSAFSQSTSKSSALGAAHSNLHEFPEVDLCRVGDDACHGKGCLLESGLETGADPAHADIRVMREVNCFALAAGLNTSSGQSCAPPRTRLLPCQQAG